MYEHGHFKIDKSKQVILFSGQGPWNDETMRRGSIEMSGVIKSLPPGKPWAQLSYLVGESLMPPSTFNTFAKQTMARKELGMQALAVVIVDSDIVNTIKQQLSQAYQPTGIAFQFFNSVADACNWLDTQGFELEHKVADNFFSSAV